MVERDLAVSIFRSDRIGIVPDLNGHIKILENTGEQSHRTHPVDLDVQKVVDRHIGASQQCHKHGDVTGREGAVVLHDKDTADQIEKHRADIRNCVEHHEEPAACHALADVELDHAAVRVLVAPVLLLLLAEELDEELAAHGHGLVEDAVDLIVARLRLTGEFPSRLAGFSRRDDKERNDADAEHREDPVLLEHHHEGDHKRDRVRQDVPERVRDHGLHARDVTRHSRDDIALVVRGEEPLRHPLQMREHLVAHIVGDMLRDPRVDIRFHNTDQVGRERQSERCDDVDDQQSHVAADDTFIEDLTGEYRRIQRHRRRDRDTHQHDRKLFPIRREVGKYSFQQRFRDLRLRRLLFFGHVGTAERPAHSSSGWHRKPPSILHV